MSTPGTGHAGAEASRLIRAPAATDRDPRRATFGAIYPTERLPLATKEDLQCLRKDDQTDDKSTVEQRIIQLTARASSIRKVVFRQCNFHHAEGAQIVDLQELTFDRCDFVKCIMGAVKYRRVRFVSCTFSGCDFMHAEFKDCTFSRCSFERSTAWDVLFVRTVIDPAAFMSGVPFPSDNYKQKPPAELRSHRREWASIRLANATQINRSVQECGDLDYSDAALYEMKRAALLDCWYRVTGSDVAPRARLADACKGATSAANLLLTRGGTSFGRLVLAGGVVLMLDAYVFLPRSTITVGGARLATMSRFSRALSAAEMVSGIGYARFVPKDLYDHALMLASAMLGLVLFALLIPVLVRRVYR